MAAAVSRPGQARYEFNAGRRPAPRVPCYQVDSGPRRKSFFEPVAALDFAVLAGALGVETVAISCDGVSITIDELRWRVDAETEDAEEPYLCWSG